MAIGGDDTLSYAAELYRHGVKVIAVPMARVMAVENPMQYSVLRTSLSMVFGESRCSSAPLDVPRPARRILENRCLRAAMVPSSIE